MRLNGPNCYKVLVKKKRVKVLGKEGDHLLQEKKKKLLKHSHESGDEDLGLQSTN